VSEVVIFLQSEVNNLSAIPERERERERERENKLNFNDMMILPGFFWVVFGKQAKLDIYRASSLNQQSMCRHIALLGHIILIQSLDVFCPYSIMLSGKAQKKTTTTKNNPKKPKNNSSLIWPEWGSN
jgi:hypothetical protein